MDGPSVAGGEPETPRHARRPRRRPCSRGARASPATPVAAGEARRRRSLRRLGVVAALLAALAAALAAGVVLLSTVFFIAVEEDGRLAIFSGLPAEVGPVPLHAVYRRSVVAYDSLSPAARTLVDQRRLRGRQDALGVSEQLGMWP